MIFPTIILKQNIAHAQLVCPSGIDSQFADGGIITISDLKLSRIIANTKDNCVRIEEAIPIIQAELQSLDLHQRSGVDLAKISLLDY